MLPSPKNIELRGLDTTPKDDWQMDTEPTWLSAKKESKFCWLRKGNLTTVTPSGSVLVDQAPSEGSEQPSSRLCLFLPIHVEPGPMPSHIPKTHDPLDKLKALKRKCTVCWYVNVDRLQKQTSSCSSCLGRSWAQGTFLSFNQDG